MSATNTGIKPELISSNDSLKNTDTTTCSRIAIGGNKINETAILKLVAYYFFFLIFSQISDHRNVICLSKEKRPRLLFVRTSFPRT